MQLATPLEAQDALYRHCRRGEVPNRPYIRGKSTVTLPNRPYIRGKSTVIEAAYYGTPVIATRPAPSRYMEWLFDRRLAVKCGSVAGTVRHAEQLIAADRTAAARKRRAAAQRVFRKMTFPLDDVVQLILRTGNSA